MYFGYFAMLISSPSLSRQLLISCSRARTPRDCLAHCDTTLKNVVESEHFIGITFNFINILYIIVYASENSRSINNPTLMAVFSRHLHVNNLTDFKFFFFSEDSSILKRTTWNVICVTKCLETYKVHRTVSFWLVAVGFHIVRSDIQCVVCLWASGWLEKQTKSPVKSLERDSWGNPFAASPEDRWRGKIRARLAEVSRGRRRGDERLWESGWRRGTLWPWYLARDVVVGCITKIAGRERLP